MVASPIRLLTALVVGVILWVGLATVIEWQDELRERQDQQAQEHRDERIRQEQRHDDCLASLGAREDSKNLTIEQWVELVRLTGGDVEDEALLAQFSDFITRQYEGLPPPVPCQDSVEEGEGEQAQKATP